MRIVVYGASGMVGQGILREAVLAEDVTEIVCIGRSSVNNSDPKIRSVVLSDMFDQKGVAEEVKDFDACFFCLGTTSLGKSEEEYSRITYDLTLSAAKMLKEANPYMVFVYMCAKGADSTEKGRVMWARVRGRLENELFGMGFKAAYSMRPSYIQPMDGIKSRTVLYRTLYDIVGFSYPLLKKISPNSVTSTRDIGRAMLNLARGSGSERILDPTDINRIAEQFEKTRRNNV